MEKKKLNVAFLGIGVMGTPMVQRLMEAGHNLTIFNRTVSKTTSLEARGAVVAKNTWKHQCWAEFRNWKTVRCRYW